MNKMTHHDYWNYMEKQPGFSDGSTFIQWKGTDVCMDIHCPNCKYHSHVDVEFFYNFECPKCHKIYTLGQSVALIEVPEHLLEYVKENSCLKTVELEDRND